MVDYFRVSRASDASSSSREGLSLDRLLSCRGWHGWLHVWRGEVDCVVWAEAFLRGERSEREVFAETAKSASRHVYHPRMDRTSDLAAFMLAGGKSTRMGTDKAFVEFEGRTLLARALDLARSVTTDVRIVGERGKFAAFAPVIEDLYPGCGPLAGIHAALRASSCDLNLILAVDMLFLTTDLLLYLVTRARNSSATVTIPRSGRGLQPLCAIYRRAFAGAAENALNEHRYKIDALFAGESTQVIREDELKAKGFSAEMFCNVNTPDELADVRRFQR